jgi:hypothetical protein
MLHMIMTHISHLHRYSRSDDFLLPPPEDHRSSIILGAVCGGLAEMMKTVRDVKPFYAACRSPQLSRIYRTPMASRLCQGPPTMPSLSETKFPFSHHATKEQINVRVITFFKRRLHFVSYYRLVTLSNEDECCTCTL